MKSLLLFTSISIILISSDWQPVQIDSSLESLSVDPTDWTYPWYVIKHDTYFENTTGEGISESDTAHLIRNSYGRCHPARIPETGHPHPDFHLLIKHGKRTHSLYPSIRKVHPITRNWC